MKPRLRDLRVKRKAVIQSYEVRYTAGPRDYVEQYSKYATAMARYLDLRESERVNRASIWHCTKVEG